MSANAPDIDLDLLGRIMRHVESGLHRFGWDSPQTALQVHVVYDHRDADTDRTVRLIGSGPNLRGRSYRYGPYATQMVYWPALLNQGDTPGWERLRTMALNVAFGESDECARMREFFRLPGIRAFMAIQEVWSTEQTAAELRAELEAGQPPRYADDPRSTEARTALAIDTADRAHVLRRDRGRKPELAMNVPRRGDISTSLRILMDCALDRSPAPEDFEQRYPTLLQTLERQD